MPDPRQRMKIEYQLTEADGPPHHLERVESSRTLDQSLPLRRSSSRIHAPRQHHQHHNQHHRPQIHSNIKFVRSFEDDLESDYLPAFYHPKSPQILTATSFDGSHPPYNPAYEKGSGLPPRPPRRHMSHQPNQHHSRYSTANFHGQPTPQPKLSVVHDNGKPPLYPHEGNRSGVLHGPNDRDINPRRCLEKSLSMSMINPKSNPRLIRKNSRCDAPQDGRHVKSKEKTFNPKRSKSIHRGFDKQKIFPQCDGDVWVERIIVDGATGKKQTYFKSVHGNLVSKEPPTGASTILYLEDIIDHRNTRAPPKRGNSQRQQAKPIEQQDQNEIVLSTSPTEDSDDETTRSSEEKSETKQPKRGKSFFGFMKKGKNKTKAEF